MGYLEAPLSLRSFGPGAEDDDRGARHAGNGSDNRCRAGAAATTVWFVGGSGDSEHPGRNGDAKRLGRLEVDDRLEFDRAHHRQIGQLFALEHTPGWKTGLYFS
jgi:hypothetical protein